MMRIHPLALLAASTLAAPTLAGEELLIGDAAPAITVSRWVKGDPVETFRNDQTYVVEFWATWCPPCRRSIPHLTALQKQYGDRVTVIGVSVSEDDPSSVPPFVEKMGDAMGYRVAMDMVTPENKAGAMASSWLTAAGQKGIPCVFIVREGKIYWIGSPFDMDEPLAAIVAGKYDLDKAVAEARLAAEREAKMRPLYEKLYKAKYAEKWDVALQLVDEIIALDPALEVKVGRSKFEYLLRLKDYDRAYVYGRKFVKDIAWNDGVALNYVAWMIVDPEQQHGKQDLELALEAARRADELTGSEDPAVIDTLAKVHFDMGKIEQAIELQKKAVKLAPEGTPLAEDLRARLEQYEKAASSEGI